MIFIDTSAILARHIKKDQNHTSATAYWAELGKSSQKLFTSNFVLDETITLLARWVVEQEAVQTALPFYASDAITILRPEEHDEIQALEFLRKSEGMRYSFTDCISFALMRRYRIKKAFAYDADFTTAGFNVVPN